MIDDIVLPSEIAAEVVMMISSEKGMPMNDALVLFMQSDTFRRLVSEPDILEMGSDRVLSMYYEEASGHGLRTDRV